MTDRVRNFLEPTLCFVKGNWAYFKTDSDEVPDNWDVVPFTYVDPPQGFIKLQFCVDMERPDDPYPEDACPYSVDMINSGEVPWLRLGNDVGIMGGCPLSEFVRLVNQNSGAVALPAPWNPCAHSQVNACVGFMNDYKELRV